MPSFIDHLVITAPSLESGVAFVRDSLGVDLQPGGEHPRMGTHNRFVKLSPRTYLEAIAINPVAPAPNRPRWFGMDNPERHPRLATWVARTDDIRTAVSRSPIPLGNVEAMSRGGLNWLITIPRDGSLVLNGIAPALIQWPPGVHPTQSLEDRGCHLEALEIFHPNVQRVREMLQSIELESEVVVSDSLPDQPPYFVAHIVTPKGVRTLSSQRNTAQAQ